MQLSYNNNKPDSYSTFQTENAAQGALHMTRQQSAR